jgi:hypothetical protein
MRVNDAEGRIAHRHNNDNHTPVATTEKRVHRVYMSAHQRHTKNGQTLASRMRRFMRREGLSQRRSVRLPHSGADRRF